MPHAVCDAKSLPMGHLGLTNISAGQAAFVLPVAALGRRWLLMLPSKSPESQYSFRLRELTESYQKVVNLGSEFFFDYSIDDITISEHEFSRGAGSLVLHGNNLAIRAIFGSSFSRDGLDGGVVNITTGQVARPDAQDACEIARWRLCLPNKSPHQAAITLTNWGQVSKTTTSPLRL